MNDPLVLIARMALACLISTSFCFAAEPSEEPVQEEDRQEQQIAAGHSAHGEAFNEGPRQKAYLIGGTGKVSFPCTCASEEVQKFIDQGLGQLHGFWYYEAERSFRQAAMIDPDCAIAYWGMAMSNKNNADRAVGFIKEAVERKSKVTPREQKYIDALHAFLTAKQKGKDEDKKRRQAYVKALENIIHEYPDDIEAKAFLGLQLYNNRGRGIPISSYFAVDALLRDVLAVNPEHPCHHYIIHLWDYERPEQALASAAACGPAAPAIAHMWHMPGHIYSRLKRYHDAVWQQEASARVDHAHMMRDRVMPDQIHNFAHNNEWLIRNLIHIGRAKDAMDLAKNMIDLPRHPKYNILFGKRGSAHYGRLRLLQVLQEFELWEEVLALKETRYLEKTDKPGEQLKVDRLLARAYFHTGDCPSGRKFLDRWKTERDQLTAKQDKAISQIKEKLKAEGKKPQEIEQAVKKERAKFQGKLNSLNQAIHELEGLDHLAAQRWSEALASLKQAGRMPAGLMAYVQVKAGEKAAGLERIQKEVARNPQEVIPLAHQVFVAWQAGEIDQAKQAFGRLRKISAEIDLDSPLFARLNTAAQAFGYPQDWREPLTPANDLGKRPPLDSLGPFRWQPSPAPQWTLADHTGKTYSLKQYRGKPVVVIFYLGYGCLHCAEQLQAFAPMTEAYRLAGIELIAISTDDVQGLIQSHENYRDGTFPFPLVSNADLDVFKAYRCFDDFEDTTLHGTFLIDADGLVRWQDISYEPFMDPKFLLEESQRLLSIKSEAEAGDAPAAATSPSGATQNSGE